MATKVNDSYYLTTAIYYANASLHVGHAWEMLATDMVSRFRRLTGNDVRFSTGMDEHSSNVEKAAQKSDIKTQEYCDEMAMKAKSMMEALGITYDRFIQTSEKAHKNAASDLIKKCHDKGDIYQAKYEGHYCESCEAFYTDKDVELVDEQAVCPNHKSKVKWISEENWFFRLSKYEKALLDYYENNPDFITPQSRKNEILSFVKGGLRDFSVSRNGLSWGIPLPWDNSHVIYVWFDALTNYLTAAGYKEDEQAFKKWWPANTHVIGKDISRFHCVYWPAMLMSAEIELPKQVMIHGWLNFKGEKLSKSRGNIVTAEEMIETYGVDQLRWYILAGNNFHSDGSFAVDKLVEKSNADLANNFGNLVNRTLGMLWKYQNGKTFKISDPSDLDEASDIVKITENLHSKLESYIDGWQLSEYCGEIIDYVNLLNKYIDDNKPWALAKDAEKKDELSMILSNVIEGIRIISFWLEPVIPFGVPKIMKQIGVESAQTIEQIHWGKGQGGLINGLQTEKPEPIYPRQEYVESELLEEKSNPKKETKKVPESKNNEDVDFTNFSNLVVRVGKINEAEVMEGSDKLLKLKVNFGENEDRTVISGIRKFYDPKDLNGKMVIGIVNLKKRKIFGVLSEAMLLATSNPEGDSLHLLSSPDGASIGDRVG